MPHRERKTTPKKESAPKTHQPAKSQLIEAQRDAAHVPEPVPRPKPGKIHYNTTAVHTPGAPDIELVIDDRAKLRRLWEPVRWALFHILEKPTSAAELGEKLDLPSQRLYYHLKILEELGVIRVADRRIVGDRAERLYQRAAQRILLRTPDNSPWLPLDIGEKSMLAFFNLLMKSRNERRTWVQTNDSFMLRLTQAQAAELMHRIHAVFEEYGAGADLPPDDQPGDDYGVIHILGPIMNLDEALPEVLAPLIKSPSESTNSMRDRSSATKNPRAKPKGN